MTRFVCFRPLPPELFPRNSSGVPIFLEDFSKIFEKGLALRPKTRYHEVDEGDSFPESTCGSRRASPLGSLRRLSFFEPDFHMRNEPTFEKSLDRFGFSCYHTIEKRDSPFLFDPPFSSTPFSIFTFRKAAGLPEEEDSAFFHARFRRFRPRSFRFLSVWNIMDA